MLWNGHFAMMDYHILILLMKYAKKEDIEKVEKQKARWDARAVYMKKREITQHIHVVTVVDATRINTKQKGAWKND